MGIPKPCHRLLRSSIPCDVSKFIDHSPNQTNGHGRRLSFLLSGVDLLQTTHFPLSLFPPSLPPPPSAYRFNEPVLIAFLPSPFSFSRHIHSSAGQASGVGRGGGASLRLFFFLIESLSQCSERPETRSLVSTAAPPATMRARLFLHAQISPSSMAAMALHYAWGRRTPDLLEDSIDRQDA